MRVVGAIISLANARSLWLECARVLHESLLVSVLIYGSEKMIWREKESSGIWVIQMDNLRFLLDIKRMDKVPNLRIRQLCGVTKYVDEKIRSAMWREWRITELLRGFRYGSVLVVAQWVGRGREGLIR